MGFIREGRGWGVMVRGVEFVVLVGLVAGIGIKEIVLLVDGAGVGWIWECKAVVFGATIGFPKFCSTTVSDVTVEDIVGLCIPITFMDMRW